MRLIFKYIAIFLPFSLFTQEVDQIEVVKVEVASIIWKNQKTSEKFPTVDSNVLAVIHSIIASNFRISVSSSFQSVTHAAAELPAQKD